MSEVLWNVFVRGVAGVIFLLLRKVTYLIIGKIRKRKNDDPTKEHRS